jgi:ribosome-binding protein aMBF1 (putative translation factor)
MMKPQFIRTEQGEELVVLPRRLYDEFVAWQKNEREEDEGTRRIVERSNKALAEGRDILIPAEVTYALVDGANPIRVLREWRHLTQADLAKGSRLTQSYISQLESGASAGTPKALRAIAKALKVPLDLIVPG